MDRLTALMEAAAGFGVALAPTVAEKLLRLAALVETANERVRLTAISTWEDFLSKHLLDSLAPLKSAWVPAAGQTVADLGSGGGFPGLVLAAAWPEIGFTLVESTKKKASFLCETAAVLGLGNVTVAPIRSEELAGGAGRNSYDFVTARAVAELPVLLELVHPLLRVGGMLMAWKGPGLEMEMQAAAPAMALLGAEVREIVTYDLPNGAGRHALVLVKKTGPTLAGYPRRPGMAEKKPLGIGRAERGKEANAVDRSHGPGK